MPEVGLNGVGEESAGFAGPLTDAFAGLARYRTFGPEGPMYEVLAIQGDKVLVWLSNRDEEIELELASVLADPLAH